MIYTEETDPNHLLGRPNGYLSKATFEDTRIKQNDVLGYSPGDVEAGGSVEVFTDAVGAAARTTYIQTLAKGFPGAAEYDYLAGPVLLRVSRLLTPSQGAEYESALKMLHK